MLADALCLIASEGPAEDDFDYEDAVVFWHSKKERRVSLFATIKACWQASIPLFQVPPEAPDDEPDFTDDESTEWQI